MGFLDQSTNNIILDAVLTDRGRKALAKNDGSFKITKFSLSDDEIDYTLIKKYGRSVGREKIELNTPILEAMTSNVNALKYSLVSTPSRDLRNVAYLKTIGIDNESISLDLISVKSARVQVVQRAASGIIIPRDLFNQIYEITVNDRFLGVSSGSGRHTAKSIDSSRIATYRLPRDQAEDPQNRGSSATFTIYLKSNVTVNTFKTFSVSNNSNRIRTLLTIKGLNDGQVANVEVLIDKS